MTDNISHAAEEWYGIKVDPDDAKKLKEHLKKTYGDINEQIIKKVFSSGEAAEFLTVNETYFFREPVHFSLLKDYLSALCEETGNVSPNVQICCAAVSAGCEAYSIAMLMEDFNRSISPPVSYHIDAFDINPKMIETAGKGVYSPRAMREDGSAFHCIADSYLKKLENGYQADLSLKKKINFFVHNLLDDLPPKKYDIIFFRNAFIYFPPHNREKVLFNLSEALEKGGILIMGVSETSGVQHPSLERVIKNDVFHFKKL